MAGSRPTCCRSGGNVRGNRHRNSSRRFRAHPSAARLRGGVSAPLALIGSMKHSAPQTSPDGFSVEGDASASLSELASTIVKAACSRTSHPSRANTTCHDAVQTRNAPSERTSTRLRALREQPKQGSPTDLRSVDIDVSTRKPCRSDHCQVIRSQVFACTRPSVRRRVAATPSPSWIA
jgi:hypothetical protein